MCIDFVVDLSLLIIRVRFAIVHKFTTTEHPDNTQPQPTSKYDIPLLKSTLLSTEVMKL